MGDLHFGTDSAGSLRPGLEHLTDQADLFLMAGDLTRYGERDEAAVLARELAGALADLEADVKIALLHYSPIKGTLQGERLEIYPFLGSYLLAEAIDGVGADLVLHGHAHHGTEKGVTPGGIHVRNVALPVVKHAYNLYCLRDGAVRSRAAAV